MGELSLVRPGGGGLRFASGIIAISAYGTAGTPLTEVVNVGFKPQLIFVSREANKVRFGSYSYQLLGQIDVGEQAYVPVSGQNIVYCYAIGTETGFEYHTNTSTSAQPVYWWALG